MAFVPALDSRGVPTDGLSVLFLGPPGVRLPSSITLGPDEAGDGAWSLEFAPQPADFARRPAVARWIEYLRDYGFELFDPDDREITSPDDMPRRGRWWIVEDCWCVKWFDSLDEATQWVREHADFLAATAGYS